MIQHWLKDRLAEAMPNLTITVDYEADEPSFATVFYEGGSTPGPFDSTIQTLQYMVWIESEDWGFAEYAARQIAKTLHDYPERPVITVEYFDANDNLLGQEPVQLLRLSMQGEPNPLGIAEGKRRFSINFDAVLSAT